MPHIYTDEQRQIRDEARRLLEERYSGAALKTLLETEGQYDAGFWQACRDMGWTAITIPETHGGLGLTAIELGIVAEECGRVACGAPFLTTSFAVSEALRLWGHAAQQDSWLPGIAVGEIIGAFAEASAIEIRDGRLHGTATAVVAGGVADVAVILAGDAGLLVADLRQDGIVRELARTFDNSRCTADLRFDGLPVQTLANEGAGRTLLDRLAVIVAFEQVGGADACMLQARDYANERQAFGQPIGKFQAIKHRIAEMYVANELARGNALRAAIDLAENSPELPLHAAAARLSAINAYEFAARESIQIHGAIGVTWEHDLHLHYRRSRSLALELGSVLEWEDMLADALRAAA